VDDNSIFHFLVEEDPFTSYRIGRASECAKGRCAESASLVVIVWPGCQRRQIYYTVSYKTEIEIAIALNYELNHG